MREKREEWKGNKREEDMERKCQKRDGQKRQNSQETAQKISNECQKLRLSLETEKK